MNDPQENEHFSHVMYIEQSYLSFKKDIELIDKDYGEINGGASTR